MKPCIHPGAYLVSTDRDLTDEDGPDLWHFECPRCGAVGPTVDGMELAAATLNLQAAVVH